MVVDINDVNEQKFKVKISIDRQIDRQIEHERAFEARAQPIYTCLTFNALHFLDH